MSISAQVHPKIKFHSVSSKDFFPELVQVTHSNMVPRAFRCPSPCWAPFGPTEHSRLFQTFTCHCLPRSSTLFKLSWASLSLHYLYPWTYMQSTTNIDGKEREMEDRYLWSSLRSQLRRGHYREKRRMRSLAAQDENEIHLCCKLIRIRLQVRHDLKHNESRE